ncbi:MAG: hypothetical protein OEY88_01185 [Candidatus Bathyarchaeota archaeon]|nr:hypothetical protein [Candidatus Bathyarchaeota archaeon]
MEYQFRPLEWNSLKGVIGEQIARSFIRTQLAPRLITKEGWNTVVLSTNDYRRHRGAWNEKLFRFDHFREDFIVHGVCADTMLLSKYAMVIGVLGQNQCTPDGLLLKLRETGRTKRWKKSACPSIAELRIRNSPKYGSFFEFPIVEGDLEVVEIKCGRNAKLMGKQKETYNNLIAKGVPLRMVNVRIISFDRNKFLVEERKFKQFL